MNLLLGRINWTSTEDKRIQENNRFSNRILDLEIKRMHNFNFDNKNFIYNNKTKILCAIVGYISNLEEIKSKNSIKNKNDVEIIEKLYRLKGLNFISDLDGVFSIFIWDEGKQKSYLFQDEHSSFLPLYYTYTKKGFIFSTCLKNILKELPFKRELNIKAVYNFLDFQLVPNKSTLIKRINKLPPRHYIIIDYIKNSLRIKKWGYKKRKVTKEFAKDNLIKSIKNNINTLSRNLNSKNLTCLLSSGFDTNIVLHFLTKLKQVKLTAVTIGALVINEIPRARLCANQYKNVKYITGSVKINALNHFPAIVWISEGYVYNDFIFLYHEICEKLKKDKIKFIFRGDTADLLLDQYRNSKIGRLESNIRLVIDYCNRRIFKKEPVPNDSFFLTFLKLKNYFRKNVSSLTVKYYWELDISLKTCGMLTNSYGIQSIDPFLNKNTKMISDSLGRLNAEKRFYRKEVKKLLDKRISKHVSYIKWSEMGYMLKDKHDLITKLLRSEFVEGILSRKQINNIAKNPQYHFLLIGELFYLYLFNELFISGKFDSKFNDSHLNMPLNNFFK